MHHCIIEDVKLTLQSISELIYSSKKPSKFLSKSMKNRSFIIIVEKMSNVKHKSTTK